MALARSVRIFQLVDYLSPYRGRRIADIANRFGVSERTVFRDLADLQAAHVAIYHDPTGYKLMETANLRPLNLTAQEHALLKVALHNPMLRRQPALARTLAVLEGKLDAAVAQAEESPRALQLAPIERSGPKAEKALELLQIAVEKRQTVEMRYASLSGGTTKERRLDPWQVFQRANTWYVVGRCHVNAEPRIFRLDRVSGVMGLAHTFELPADFDIEAHLEDAWSMIRGNTSYDVVLEFAPALAALILNARHHHGEKTKKRRDGTIEYRVRLSSLEEITRWIVGFGGQCRVVAPEELATRVRKAAEGILATQA
jgi:proteasome accessory factor B